MKVFAILLLSVCLSSASILDNDLVKPRNPRGLLTHSRKVSGSYIIKFRKETPTSKLQDMALKSKSGGGEEVHVMETLKMAVLKGQNEEDMRRLALSDPDIEYIEEDGEYSIAETASCLRENDAATWGLDAIDGAIDGKIKQASIDGVSHRVHGYVLDSGIDAQHPDFENRAMQLLTFINYEENADLNGHGTHCAGTVGGKNWGVAKKASIFGVKVLNSAGSGNWSDLIRGIDWSVYNINYHQQRAVISMSLGGYGVVQSVIDSVEAAVASGIPVVVAAGNDNMDVKDFTPAAAPSAITVGAVDYYEDKAYFSCYGDLVDIQAPGVHIKSTYPTKWGGVATMSGTSMATPHVAGVILNLMQTTEERLTPSQILDWLLLHARPIKNPHTLAGGTTSAFLQTPTC